MPKRMSSLRCLSLRGLALLVALAAGPALAVPAWSQDAPPPETKTKVKPKAPKGGKGGGAAQGAGGSTTAPAAPPTLLIDADMSCTVMIDGDKTYKVKANEITKIQVPVGEHLLKATSDDGKKSLEQVVKASGSGTMVVQLNLSTAVAAANPEEFDRAAARVCLGLSDLLIAGQYAGSILNKSWGFHDKNLSTAIFTAQQFLKREMDEFKKFTPNDPGRQRIATELARAATDADKYVDLLTKAISAAQQANSWLGEPMNMYGQAKALEQSIVPVAPVMEEMKRSGAFVAAVPPDRHPLLGLPRDPKDFDFGALAYMSTPQLLATVQKGGMAENMGFKAGDKLISAGGKPVTSLAEFKQMLRTGGKLSVTYERGGKQETKDMSASFGK